MKGIGLLARRVVAAAVFGLFVGCAGSAVAQASLLSDSDEEGKSCMTDRMLRNFLADQGYSNVKLNVSHGRNWPAQGVKGGQRYLLTVDTCSRQIYFRGGR